MFIMARNAGKNQVIIIDDDNYAPGLQVCQWSNKVLQKFCSYYESEEVKLKILMEFYYKSLRTEAVHFDDYYGLKNKMLQHMQFLYNLYMDLTFMKSSFTDTYLENMEDILTFFCESQIKYILQIKRFSQKNDKESDKLTSQTYKEITYSLKVYLLNRLDHIYHVLIRQTMHSNHKAFTAIFGKILRRLFFKERHDDFSDETFCRSYLLIQQLKSLMKKQESKEECEKHFLTLYRQSTESIKKNPTLSSILLPSYSVADKVMQLYGRFATLSRNYFEHIKSIKFDTDSCIINLDDLDLSSPYFDTDSCDDNNFNLANLDLDNDFLLKLRLDSVNENNSEEADDSDDDIIMIIDGIETVISEKSDISMEYSTNIVMPKPMQPKSFLESIEVETPFQPPPPKPFQQRSIIRRKVPNNAASPSPNKTPENNSVSAFPGKNSNQCANGAKRDTFVLNSNAALQSDRKNNSVALEQTIEKIINSQVDKSSDQSTASNSAIVNPSTGIAKSELKTAEEKEAINQRTFSREREVKNGSRSVLTESLVNTETPKKTEDLKPNLNAKETKTKQDANNSPLGQSETNESKMQERPNTIDTDTNREDFKTYSNHESLNVDETPMEIEDSEIVLPKNISEKETTHPPLTINETMEVDLPPDVHKSNSKELKVDQINKPPESKVSETSKSWFLSEENGNENNTSDPALKNNENAEMTNKHDSNKICPKAPHTNGYNIKSVNKINQREFSKHKSKQSKDNSKQKSINDLPHDVLRSNKPPKPIVSETSKSRFLMEKFTKSSDVNIDLFNISSSEESDNENNTDPAVKNNENAEMTNKHDSNKICKNKINQSEVSQHQSKQSKDNEPAESITVEKETSTLNATRDFTGIDFFKNNNNSFASTIRNHVEEVNKDNLNPSTEIDFSYKKRMPSFNGEVSENYPSNTIPSSVESDLKKLPTPPLEPTPHEDRVQNPCLYSPFVNSDRIMYENSPETYSGDRNSSEDDEDTILDRFDDEKKNISNETAQESPSLKETHNKQLGNIDTGQKRNEQKIPIPEQKRHKITFSELDLVQTPTDTKVHTFSKSFKQMANVPYRNGARSDLNDSAKNMSPNNTSRRSVTPRQVNQPYIPLKDNCKISKTAMKISLRNSLITMSNPLKIEDVINRSEVQLKSHQVGLYLGDLNQKDVDTWLSRTQESRKTRFKNKNDSSDNSIIVVNYKDDAVRGNQSSSSYYNNEKFPNGSGYSLFDPTYNSTPDSYTDSSSIQNRTAKRKISDKFDGSPRGSPFITSKPFARARSKRSKNEKT